MLFVWADRSKGQTVSDCTYPLNVVSIMLQHDLGAKQQSRHPLWASRAGCDCSVLLGHPLLLYLIYFLSVGLSAFLSLSLSLSLNACSMPLFGCLDAVNFISGYVSFFTFFFFFFLPFSHLESCCSVLIGWCSPKVRKIAKSRPMKSADVPA